MVPGSVKKGVRLEAQVVVTKLPSGGCRHGITRRYCKHLSVSKTTVACGQDKQLLMYVVCLPIPEFGCILSKVLVTRVRT